MPESGNQISRHRRRRHRRLDGAPRRWRRCSGARCMPSPWSNPTRSAPSASARRRSRRSSLFNKMLGIDEDEFMRADPGHLQARHRVRRLGRGWATATSTPSAASGLTSARVPFHQYWLKRAQPGKAATLERLLAARAAAAAGQASCRRAPIRRASPLAEIAYAYHFDAALYARVPAPLRRSTRRRAHRGQDRRGAAARRRRLRRARCSSKAARASTATCSSTARDFAAC